MNNVLLVTMVCPHVGPAQLGEDPSEAPPPAVVVLSLPV